MMLICKFQIILIAGLAIFLSKPACPNTSSWYEYLYPISVGINLITTVILHIIFSGGLAVSHPGKWVKTVSLSLFFDTSKLIITTVGYHCESFIRNFNCNFLDYYKQFL